MIALNATNSDENSSKAIISMSNTSAVRRRKPKGTIAGFGQNIIESSDRLEEASATSSTTSTQVAAKQRKNQPQHRSTNSSNSTDIAAVKNSPSHSARLALLCCQNVLHYKTRTQLSLCPPGHNRRTLQAAMRTKQRRCPSPKNSPKQEGADEAFYGLDKLLGENALEQFLQKEEEYLLSSTTFDLESDEEASSGDEDDLGDLDDILGWDQTATITSSAGQSSEEKYSSLREPLFTAPGSDPPNKGQATSGTAAKLPFHHRKIRLFDQVSSQDRAAARVYLRDQIRKGHRRDGRKLYLHLKQMQRLEKRRLQVEHGEIPDTDIESDPVDEVDAMDDSVSMFGGAMTPSLSVALLLESLALNPLESVEGMCKCYDGIVAAGVALLDAAVRNEQPSRSEIIAALAPLLITSLEQASGDVILQLSKMRRMCGTPRYQRRFVQRIAPLLVRPPRGAIWCLKHQNDMEPILAAMELIFDSAGEVFSKGWHDRGQQLLADSARKETLNTAADQLRNLSSDADGGLGLHKWRQNRMSGGSTQSKDVGRAEPLAEWEVIAVDRQIRKSIGNILSMDWSRVTESTRDTDTLSSRRSRSTGSTSHSGIRSNRAGEITKNAGPRSPLRQMSKSMYSPGLFHAVAGAPPAPENLESVFGPSFTTQPISTAIGRRSVSPDMTMSPTSLPGSPNSWAPRKSIAPLTPKSNYPEMVSSTPPRSPPNAATTPLPSPYLTRLDVLSPHQPLSIDIPSSLKSPLPGIDRAPLSPSASTSSADIFPHSRHLSSNSSVASGGTSSSQPAHYRMLTSTAAERKRTVAACRALRSQIQRFEEAFMQLHGRPPKGASERSPLATTYAQYREWKRAIRADAACRIQALFRGAMTRWTLLRSINPRLSRVVTIRAGRLGATDPTITGKLQSESLLKRLSIPVEIGIESERGIGLSPIIGSLMPAPPTTTSNQSDNIGVEVFINPVHGSSPASAASASPTWNSGPPRLVLRSGSSQDRDVFSPKSPPQYSPPSGSPNAGMLVEMASMSLPELQSRKRDLKQQLKQYDMDFARKNGRMPVKAEKEPIRHLYENYNTLKSEITRIEQEGTGFSRKAPPPLSLQQPQIGGTMRAQRSPSPPLARSTSGSGHDSTTSSESDSNSPDVVPAIRLNRKPSAMGVDSVVSSTPTGTPSQDSSALKAEKGKLHQMLRSYEKDFFKEHKRQVSSFADIKPVASQYRRYKEIKKAIAALPKGGGEK